MDTEDKIVLVAGCVRFISKTFLVFSLVEYAAFRVGGGHHRFPLLRRLFPAVLRKGLFPVFFPVFVHFLKQFFCVPFRLFGNRLSSLLFQVRTCLNVGSIHKNRFRVQISFLCRGFQHPPEHMLHRGVVKPVLEVVTYRGKMRYRLVQRISNEPPVCQVHAHFFQSSAERRKPVYMLDQHNLEQHHWVYAWPAVVLAVQIFHKFVYLFEIDCCVDLSQQVILWDHVLQIYKFKLSTIFCFFYQHLYHPSLLYRILSLNSRISNEKKGHLLVTFFDRLKRRILRIRCGVSLPGLNGEKSLYALL